MKKSLALLLALLMCVGLLAGCAKDETPDNPDQPSAGGEVTPEPEKKPDPAKPEPEKKPAEKKVLKLLRSGEDNVLNPHDANNSANYALVDYMVATLYDTLPSEDGLKAVKTPVFADGYPEVAADGLTWTIKLVKDAKWPDGQKITADDWMYSWKMTMDPKLMYKTGSGSAKGSSAEIENAYAYYKSEAEKTDVKWEDVGLKKIDDYTIQAKMAYTITQLDCMRHFSSRAMGLVRKDIYEKCISADGMTCDYGSTPDKVMFCGPYLLEKWLKGSECTMVKNPDYPLADKLHIDEVFTRVVQDESTRLELFENNECDYITLGTNGFAKYGEDPRVHEVTGKTINTLEVNHNNPDKPYLDDATFRKAIFWAIDRTSIAKLTNTLPAPYFISTEGQILDDGTTYRNYGPAKEIVPENGGYDPELAKKYLDEAFKKFNLDKVTLVITYNEEADGRRAASEYIQSTFDEIFGGKLHIELQATNKSAMLKLMRTSNANPVNTWDLCWSGWGLSAESYAPWRKVKCYTSDYSGRYTPYKNYELDKLCELAMTDEYRLDDEKLAQLTVEMEKTMYEDMTCVPVMQSLTYSMHSERMIPAMKVSVSGIGWGNMWSDMK